MDCRAAVIFCLSVVLMAIMISEAEGRNKKVVIHVPYKVKKIKHTHTVYKTFHHHHGSHHDGLLHEPSHAIHHLAAPPEEHEHFHHMHIHDDHKQGGHSQPVGIGIPDFLPDVPLDMSEIPDVPDLMSGRHHSIPLFRRVAEELEDEED